MLYQDNRNVELYLLELPVVKYLIGKKIPWYQRQKNIFIFIFFVYALQSLDCIMAVEEGSKSESSISFKRYGLNIS